MPSNAIDTEYPFRSLDELMDIQGGAQPPAATFKSAPEPGYVRFVQIRDFETDSHKTYIRREDRWRYCDQRDVLIARYGASVGRICRGLSGAYNVALVKVVPKDAEIGFLYHLLRSRYFQDPLAAMSARSAQAGFNKADLSAIRVPVPPIQTQRQISAILDSFDNRIYLLKRANRSLEEMSATLFNSWFVDFDPVRAKLEGREPEGMGADLAALLPSEFVDSEFGPIPKGWRTGKLSDLSELNPESWTTRNHPKVITYIDLANVKANRIETMVNFSFDEAPSRARRALRDGDTIVGTVRPGNRSYAYICGSSPGLTGSTGFAVLRAKSSLHSVFIYLAATRDENIDHLAHVADGGAYPAVRPEVVANLHTVIPPSEVINAFCEIINPLFSKIEVNSAQEVTLTNLRDLLLPRLLSGDIKFAGSDA